jgi:hypothetical protein
MAGDDNKQPLKSLYISKHFTAEQHYGGDPAADFNLWSKAPSWTAEEATLLSMGLEPTVVNSDSMITIGDPFREEYEARLDFARRAIMTEDLKEPIRPLDYIKWAKQSGISFPKKLETLVRSQGPNSKTRPKAAESKEIASLLKMVLGLSLALYKYDVVKDARGIPTKIKNDLDLLSIPLETDTIRKWLNQAIDEFGDLLPPK